jgi:hypothetical protein
MFAVSSGLRVKRLMLVSDLRGQYLQSFEQALESRVFKRMECPPLGSVTG